MASMVRVVFSIVERAHSEEASKFLEKGDFITKREFLVPSLISIIRLGSYDTLISGARHINDGSSPSQGVQRDNHDGDSRFLSLIKQMKSRNKY